MLQLTCQICGNTQNNTTYTVREMMLGTRQPFSYFQCGHCACLQIAAIPENLSEYYPEGYNGHRKPRPDYFDGVSGLFRKLRYQASLFPQSGLNPLLHLFFKAPHYELLGSLGLTHNTRILDVGCGLGADLYPLPELGVKQVRGIDPFVETVEYPNGYRVEQRFIQDMTGQWDVILFNHSFEHVPNPQETLEAVQKLLSPTGTCLIRVPTVDSYAWRHYRENWYQLDAPRHLFLHSRKSMDILSAQANLMVEKVVYDSNYSQFSVSEKYANDLAMYEATPTRTSLWQRKWQKWQHQQHAETLNRQGQGDQCAFFLTHA